VLTCFIVEVPGRGWIGKMLPFLLCPGPCLVFLVDASGTAQGNSPIKSPDRKLRKAEEIQGKS